MEYAKSRDDRLFACGEEIKKRLGKGQLGRSKKGA